MGAPFPKNCLFPSADLDLICDSLASPSPQPTWNHHRFIRFYTDDLRVSQSLYFIMSRPVPLKIAPSRKSIWTPSNTWFPGTTRVLNPNGILVGSAVFCRAHLCDRPDRQPDRQLDHATRSVTIGRIYVRPNKKHFKAACALIVVVIDITKSPILPVLQIS